MLLYRCYNLFSRPVPLEKQELQNFDQYAGEYEDMLNRSLEFVGKDGEYFAEYKIDRLAEMCHKRNLVPLSILDFGSGTGKNLKHLRKHFPKAALYGTDISQDSLEIAAKLNIENCKLEHFDGESLPYKTPMFDMILAVNVFHHIPFELHESLLVGLRKTLNPDGVFVLFEHNPINPITRKIVRECPFDKDARLLKPSYSSKLLSQVFDSKTSFHYVIFVPPALKALLFVEKFIEWLPLGAQYAAFAGNGSSTQTVSQSRA